MSEIKPTSTPWIRSCFQVYGADKSRVAHTGMGQLPPHRSHESEANAALIVEAVNNHDTLKAEIARLTPYVEAFRREETRADKLAREVDDLRSELEQAKGMATITDEMIENGCRGMYGTHWDGPKDKQPGPEMKEVWRRHARKCLSAAFTSTEEK